VINSARTDAVSRGFKIHLLFHHHPPQLPQESVDIHRPPFSFSAINSNRNSLPPPLAPSSVKDHINISMTGETLS
jgi:hypothetical protein